MRVHSSFESPVRPIRPSPIPRMLRLARIVQPLFDDRSPGRWRSLAAMATGSSGVGSPSASAARSLPRLSHGCGFAGPWRYARRPRGARIQVSRRKPTHCGATSCVRTQSDGPDQRSCAAGRRPRSDAVQRLTRHLGRAGCACKGPARPSGCRPRAGPEPSGGLWSR
jgi:hypothetical protein